MFFFRTTPDRHSASLDFWKFWTGETISSLGSSFTQFALPLLVFKLTGSALNLGIAFAFSFLPYLLFGLVIGAWVDRLDRKRVMILADLGQALVVAAIPVLFFVGALTIWSVYAVAFLSTTLHIFTDASQFAAIPSLVDQNDLVSANGRIQASFFGATILGPVLAGVLITVMPAPTLLLLDAASFLVSAIMLSLIARSFNIGANAVTSVRTSLWHDMVEGLRYLFGHPVLRNILIMLTLLNFISTNRETQLVLLAEGHLRATDFQFGLLNAAGGAGVVLFSLLAGPLRKRGGYVRLAFITIQFGAIAAIALAFSPNIWVAIPLWGLVLGTDNLFNIYSNSLRQEILPNEMLGRARAIATMMSFGALPLGAVLGGAITNATGSVVLVYAVVGALILLVATAFSIPIVADAKRLRLGEFAVQAPKDSKVADISEARPVESSSSVR
ncbi:MAG TPA: MFS transporter [Ktedonobacterales bacterium]